MTQIQTNADWGRLRGDLDLVLDPMVVRSAHVFLRGAEGLEPDRREAARDALHRNHTSLRDFVDAVVLNERLPVFDYPATFGPESALGDASSLFEASERLGLGLAPVAVLGTAYTAAKGQAVLELEDLLRRIVAGGGGGHDQALIESISSELSAFEHEWEPDLSELHVPAGGPLPSAAAVRFAFGERLFDFYARAIGGTHVLQSKRLDLALQIHVVGVDRSEWSALSTPGFLDRLAAAVNRERNGAPLLASEVLPSFLGLLLARDPRGPQDLLARAVDLRDDPAVRRHAAVLASLRRPGGDGTLDPGAVAELAGSGASLAAALRRRHGGPLVERAAALAVGGAPAGLNLLQGDEAAAAVGVAFGLAAQTVPGLIGFLFGPGRDARRSQKLLGSLRRHDLGWRDEEAMLRLWEG